MKTKYAPLFTPIKIGNLELKNRFAMSSMGGNDRIEECGIGDKMKKYYLARARGGIGLLATGAITIRYHEPRYVAEEQFLKEDLERDLFISSTEDWIKAMHAFGAKMLFQLSIGVNGTQSKDFFTPLIDCNKITKEEIKYYVQRYADAAKLCKDAGIDMVEVHSVHTAYIVDQFCSTCVNHRTDEYGGSLENRARFVVEILRAIKEACGEDYPVSLKVGARSTFTDIRPDGEVIRYYREFEESLELCKYFAEAGFDAINLDGVRNISVYTPERTNIEYWKRVKESINVPLIASGSLADPELMLYMLENGYCDVFANGRQSLCDPNYVNKLKANKIEDIRFCIKCLAGCITNSIYGLPVTCALNPTAGCDADEHLVPAVEKKKVYVIGGGMGGMEAAMIAAQRGHDVTLFEKTNEFGGLFNAAAAFDFKAEDRRLIKWYERQLQKTSAQICMGFEVTPEFIEENEPDVVIIATGSHEIIPNIPGRETNHVITVAKAARKQVDVGSSVAIIGGGLSGCELAAQLGEEGKKVTLIEMMPKLMATMFRPTAYKIDPLVSRVRDSGVDIRTSTKLKEIRSGSVIIEDADGEHEITADTVVMAVGFRSNNSLYTALQDYAGEVYRIGDCNRVNDAYSAIWDGYNVATGI